MLVKVMSVFDCSSQQLFTEMKKTKSLVYIAKPLIKFVPLPEHPLPEVWEEGKYLVNMYLFSFIPLGTQWIVLSVDYDKLILRDNGYSKWIKKWDHHIYLKDIGNNKTLYADTIEIDAGPLTVFVALFAGIFYRWRQKRWRKLIKNNFDYQ